MRRIGKEGGVERLGWWLRIDPSLPLFLQDIKMGRASVLPEMTDRHPAGPSHENYEGLLWSCASTVASV